MRQQRIDRHKPAKAPEIIDNRQPSLPTPQMIDPAIANLPLRTVLLVEVGDMEPAAIQLLIQELNRVYVDAQGGIHYVVPIRNGKIGSDIIFEKEWLEVVQKTCEVKDGEIVLKEGVQEANIVRQQI